MEVDEQMNYNFLVFDPAPRRGEPHVSSLKILSYWSIDMAIPMSVRLDIGPLT